MKRPLAIETHYSVEHYDSHHPVPVQDSDEVIDNAKKRLEAFDPDSSKELALLKEMSGQIS
jgi:hypothetical protein